MQFRFDRARRRLNVSSSQSDLGAVESLIQQAFRDGVLPARLDAITYRTGALIWIMRGPHLRRWISGKSLRVPDIDAVSPAVPSNSLCP